MKNNLISNCTMKVELNKIALSKSSIANIPSLVSSVPAVNLAVSQLNELAAIVAWQFLFFTFICKIKELEEEWELMKESLVGHASDVCGKRFVGGCMRKGSEWWNEGVKMKVEEKKSAFEEWLQCNSVEKYERYREKNVEAKRKVEEAKRMSNFKWGRDFDRSYEENKKKFWKKIGE